MLRLLVVTPCDGEDVGEVWAAHQWVRHLSTRHEVTLLTYYKHGRTAPSRQLPTVRVVEWAEPPLVGRAERLNSMLKPGYLPFYFRARRWIRQALAGGSRFDAAFQPAPVAMRYPSPLAGFSIPYVIGPLGGSLPTPAGFAKAGDVDPWYVRLRAIDGFRIRHDPLLRSTYTGASCVLGIAPYVRDFLADVQLQRFETMPDAGIDVLPEPIDRTGRRGDVRLLFVGRIIRTKGLRDAIRALGLVRDLPAVFDIVGDGYDRHACEGLVSELGLTSRVSFHGRLPRERIDAFYQSADIFLFPSYREAGGLVVFEAMANGLPLIVSDVGGPGAAVDAASGIKVRPTSPDEFAKDIASAIASLVSDNARRESLGNGARRRVTEIGLWDAKVDQLDSVFHEIIARPPN